MEQLTKINNDTGVKLVPRLLFGNDLMLNVLKNNTGLIYGLKRVTA